MYIIIVTLHVIVSILLIAIVLFQVGKGAGLAGLIGGGSSDALVTGASGNVIMKKITAGLAIGFMVLSLILSIMSAQRPKRSLMDIMPPEPVMPTDEFSQTVEPKEDLGTTQAGTEK